VTPSPLPHEFRTGALVERIVRGAAEHDSVRLHGAIVAALEIHGSEGSQAAVFPIALRAVRECCADCHGAAESAIRAHLEQLPEAA
jgi:hypothetical protein